MAIEVPRTAQQEEAEKKLLPTLTGWMDAPPKVQTPTFTPTTVNYGGARQDNGSYMSWTPAKTAAAAPAQAAVQPSTSSAQSEYEKKKARLDALKAIPFTGGTETSLVPYKGSVMMEGGAAKGFRPGSNYSISLVGSPGNYYTIGTKTKVNPYASEIATLEKEIAGFDAMKNAPGSSIRVDPAPVVAPAATTTQRGSLNLSAAPVAEASYGKEGAYQKQDWSQAFDKLGQEGYESQDWTSDFDGLAGRTDGQRFDRTAEINAATRPGQFKYDNALERDTQGKILAGDNANLQEGFDASYLKDLAAAGIAPLQEGYADAVRTAGADFNRMGLGASGFELGNKYGSNADSITSRYLKNVADVTRDVALKGAEAAREDRWQNAARQDSFLDRALSLSGRQSDDQFRRASAEQDTSLKGLELLQGQDAANEDMRRADRDYASDLLTKKIGAKQTDEQNRQDWSKIDSDNLSKRIAADQTDEENRQDWAKFLDKQRQNDYGNKKSQWQSEFDTGKWLTSRDDSAQQINNEANINDQISNLNWWDKGITHLLNFIANEGEAASGQAGRDAASARAAADREAQEDAAKANAMGGLFGTIGTILGGKK